MQKDEIYNKIKEVITPYVNDESLLDDINESTKFIKDLDINSAHFIDVILDFEEAFEVIIDDDDVVEMETVGQSVKVLSELLLESV